MAEASPARHRTGPVRPRGRADQGWLAEQERRDHGLPGTRARAENAAFPLVPSSEDIRRAIFQTLSGSEPYEVVDGNGEALAISPLDARFGIPVTCRSTA